jgi:Ca2+-binding RTX toxin-like protein
MRPRWIICLAVAVLATSASPAGAARLGRIDGDAMLYGGEPGEANSLRITQSGDSFVFDDLVTISVSSDSGCTRGAEDLTVATCPGPFSRFEIEAGEENDVVDADVSIPVKIFGGPGNDVLRGGSAGDTINGGEGDDAVDGAGGGDDMREPTDDPAHPTGGQDAVGYDTHDRPVTVVLSSEPTADDGADGEHDIVDSTIERVVGTKLGDHLSNLAGMDALLEGGDGDDTLSASSGGRLIGGKGNDRFEAGPGSRTTVSYEERGSTEPVQARIPEADATGVQPNGGPGENDTISPNVANLVGGQGADRLTGNRESNRLDGGPGFDVLDGGLGSDVIFGNEDNDVVLYDGRSRGVTVDLSRTGRVNGEPGEGDEIESDVEIVAGTPFNDVITGSERNEDLYGQAGNDRLNGGKGHDGLFGGPGADTIFTRDATEDRIFCDDVRQAAIDQGPNLLIRGGTLRLGRDGRLRLRLSCRRNPSHRCVGTIRLERVLRSKGPRAQTGQPVRTKPQTVRLGGARYRLQEGRSTVIAVGVGFRQRQAIRRAHKVAARAISIEPDANGKPKTTVVPLTVRA